MADRQSDAAACLRLVAAEARDMLTALHAPGARLADLQVVRSRLAEWVDALDHVAALHEASNGQSEPPVKGLVVEALNGADIEVNGVDFSLHDMTQLAAALRPGASLTVRNSESLSPLEQTSIWTVMPGQVRFV